jgi:hypothetical protein
MRSNWVRIDLSRHALAFIAAATMLAASALPAVAGTKSSPTLQKVFADDTARFKEAVALADATDTAPHAAGLNVPPEGYVALFNGKDLTGWKGLVADPKKRMKMSRKANSNAQVPADELMREHWKVVDGALVFDGSKKGANICTIKDYGNFEMLVDWKIERGGDSGVYLRGSPQVQIWDPDEPREFKNGCQKGSGALWNNKTHERFPLVRADNPIGEWNTFRIRMIGDKVTVWLNGKLVTDNVVMENYWEKYQKPMYATGAIELQNHNHPLYFRNVFVKELP